MAKNFTILLFNHITIILNSDYHFFISTYNFKIMKGEQS